MKIEITALLIYALLLFAGGVIGFFVAHSTPSLIAGTICSLLVAAAGWGMIKEVSFAPNAAILLSTFLTLFFGYRFFLTMKFMPAGLMAILSVAILLLLISKKYIPISSS